MKEAAFEPFPSSSTDLCVFVTLCNPRFSKARQSLRVTLQQLHHDAGRDLMVLRKANLYGKPCGVVRPT